MSLELAKKSVAPNGSAFKQSPGFVEDAEAEELVAVTVADTEAEAVLEAEEGAEALGWEAEDAPEG